MGQRQTGLLVKLKTCAKAPFRNRSAMMKGHKGLGAPLRVA
jgi:hypothetical protein